MLNGGRGGAGRAQGNPRASRAAIPNQAEPQHASFNIHHSAFAVHHSAFAVRHSAFSMVELMFAVVILGIGMLITSSMFPIAWFKAREVAEATVVPALADAAEANIRLSARRSPRTSVPIRRVRLYFSFFPGDWIPLAQPAPIGGGNRDPAFIYPDMRVHHLNAGNYLADRISGCGDRFSQ
jgi:prepilin-type N-terminal cleavage/methylation domain-containing protein